jgi:SpoU rRNA methylase family enzyme
MANENVVLKVLFDTSEAVSSAKNLDKVMQTTSKATDDLNVSLNTTQKELSEFDKNIKGGADGLKNLAQAKKQFNDISIASSTKEVKELANELQNVLMKDKEFMKMAGEVAKAVEKGAISNAQAFEILEDAINKGVNSATELGKRTEEMTVKTKSFRTEMNELKNLINSGKLTGDELVIAKQRLVEMTKTANDTNKEIKLLSSDTKLLSTAMSGLSLGVGIFASLQGASALFGVENDKVQQALLKVNGAMAVLQGLEQVQNALKKDSIFLIGAQSLALELYTFVVGASTGAMKLFRIALAATGIGLAVIAIATLIANYDKLKKAVEENSEGFQKFKEVLFVVLPVIALIIEAIQFLSKNIDNIKSTIAGLSSAFSTAFEGIGNIVSGGLKDGFKGIVNKFKDLGKQTSDSYTKAYIEQEQINAQKRLNEFAKASQEFKNRQILLLKAQGKDTYNLEAEQVNRSVNILKNGLDEKEKEELRNIKGIELKLKQKIALSNDEAKLYNKKSEKITEILKAENERDIFYANRERELAEKHKERLKENAEKVKAQKEKEKAQKEKERAGSLLNLIAVFTKEIEFLQETLTLKEIDLSVPLRLEDVNIDDVLDYTERLKSAFLSATASIGGDFSGVTSGLGGLTTSLFDLNATKKAIQEQRLVVEFAYKQLESTKIDFNNKMKEANKQLADAEKDGNEERIKEAKRTRDKLTQDYDKSVQEQQSNIKKQESTLLSLEDGLKKASGQIAKYVGDIFLGFTQIISNSIDRNIANLDKLIEKQKVNVAEAKQIADKGNSQLYDAELKKEAKLQELRREQARKKKAIAIAEILINNAVGIANIWAQWGSQAPAGPIIAGVLTGLLAALTAVQIGVVSSQQFRKGGKVPTGMMKGASHEQGGIKFGVQGRNELYEMEGDEFIFNRETSLKNQKWFDKINNEKIDLDNLLASVRLDSMQLNPILSTTFVNQNGQLEDRLKQVEKAIIDLPNRMPQASFNADSRGLSFRMKQIIDKENAWKR